MRRERPTLQEAIRHFSDPTICLEFLANLRWPGGVTCPRCGNKEVGFLASRNLFQCKHRHPKRHFSVKVGTIFEDSPIGLEKWLPAIWMIANDKHGISSYELHRALGVTQKTAWFMLHRISLAMETQILEKERGERSQVGREETNTKARRCSSLLGLIQGVPPDLEATAGSQQVGVRPTSGSRTHTKT